MKRPDDSFLLAALVSVVQRLKVQSRMNVNIEAEPRYAEGTQC